MLDLEGVGRSVGMCGTFSRVASDGSLALGTPFLETGTSPPASGTTPWSITMRKPPTELRAIGICGATKTTAQPGEQKCFWRTVSEKGQQLAGLRVLAR